MVADVTAGGWSNDKPVWQMDKNVIITALNAAYESKVTRRSYPYYDSNTCLQDRKAALIGFKQFTSGSTTKAPSELHTLLLYEDDNLSAALKWALDKLSKEHSSVVHRAARILHHDTYTTASSREW